MGLRIGMTYDLRRDYLALGFTPEQVAEFDMDATVDGLEDGLRANGYTTDRIGHGRALCQRLVQGDHWDLVFNICEGVRGRSREAQVPAILELYGIPYTFADPLTCAVTLDKAVAKRIVADCGLRTPRHLVVERLEDIAGCRLPYPLFAKPIAEGTGKGVSRQSRSDNPEELAVVCAALLAEFHQPVLVEEFLPGREFTTAVLGTGDEARILGTMEITVRDPAHAGIYSYENKEYCDRHIDYSNPPRDALRRNVEKLALAAYRVLGCRDASRVDIRLDSRGRPSFMEVNPLAGLHPQHSDLPLIATQEGMSYPDLLRAIVDSACRRNGIREL